MRYVKHANGMVPFSKDVADETLMELSPATGMSASHSLTRNTTATLIDYEGIIRTAKIGELRMERARRVENLFNNSGTPVTQTITVVVGREYTISCAGTGDITLSDAATGVVNISSQLTVLATTSSLICTLSGSIERPQIEDVTGQTDQTASEYVSNGVESFPYHGAGVDGVKYFQTKKDGLALDEDPYFLVEKQGGNLFLNSDTPVTQTITVVSGKDYTIKKMGTGSIQLSGAGNGTVNDEITITATTTSLVCTVNGVVDMVQVEQSNYSSSYIAASGAAVTRSADVLKYEFGAGNFPQEFCYFAELEPLVDGTIK